MKFNGTEKIINNFYDLRLAYSRNGSPDNIAEGWKASSWSSKENQRRIFDSVMKYVDGSFADTDSILDVGCGVGDFNTYLKKHYKPGGWTYAGLDISENVINEARRQHPTAWFSCADFLEAEFEKSSDWVIAAGTFNLKLFDFELEQYPYLFSALSKMFALSDKGVVAVILSDYTNHSRGRFEDLFYYDPSKILNHCLTHITENVVIDHNSLEHQFIIKLAPSNFELSMRERNEKA